MRFARMAAIAAFVAASGGAVVDPQLLALVGPDIAAVGGLRIDEVKGTPFGTFVLSQIGSDPGMARLAASTGFDPRTDLVELVAASPGSGGGLLIARGAFQPERIVAFAGTAGATAEMYRGVSVITAPGGTDGSLAFLNATIVVAGSKALVQQAVDRWISAASASSALADRARAASASAPGWIATGPLNALRGQEAAPGQMPPAFENLLGSILGSWAGLRFNGQNIDLEGAVTARSAQDAQALADALRFVASMMQPMKQPGADAGAQPLGNGTFTADGTSLKFTMSVSENQVEQFLRPRGAPTR